MAFPTGPTIPVFPGVPVPLSVEPRVADIVVVRGGTLIILPGGVPVLLSDGGSTFVGTDDAGGGSR